MKLKIAENKEKRQLKKEQKQKEKELTQSKIQEDNSTLGLDFTHINKSTNSYSFNDEFSVRFSSFQK